MLAGIPEFREVNFSHLKIDHPDFESVEPARNPQSKLLWLALFLSSLLHLSLLLVEFSLNQPRPKQVLTQTLHIELLQAPIKKRDTEPELATKEIVEIQSDPQVTTNVVASPAPKPIITSTKAPRETQQQTRLVIEPLTSQELTVIVDNHNAQADRQSSTAISENVFHPGLRTRLNAEANKPVLARVEERGLETYTDPAGTIIVVTGSGTCLTSPPAKIGAPRNWYVSPCAGKNESEKIMDSVDMDVNGKRRFDERK